MGELPRLSESYPFWIVSPPWIWAYMLITLFDSTDADNIDNANLGLKSIIGIKCMAEIAKAVGEDADSSLYSVGLSLFCSSLQVLNGATG